MKRETLIFAICMISSLSAIATEPYSFSIRQRQDTSVGATTRMVYRLHLDTQALPDQDRMKATAEQVWSDGNRHWREFTVFMIFGPIQDFDAGAYGIAEFSPSGMSSFQINTVPLSALEMRGIPIPAPESTKQVAQPTASDNQEPRQDPFSTRFDELTTRDGRVLRRVSPQRIEGGNLVCFHSSGIESIPLRNLPDDFRKLFDLPPLDASTVPRETGSTAQRQPVHTGTRPAPRVSASDLRTGHTVVISKQTPLMPAFEPSHPVAAMSNVRRLTSGTTIRILEVRYNRGTPWYRVADLDRNQQQIGTGWINGTALLGQSLTEQAR